MSEIADFILAQYARIEAAARAATDGPWRVGDVVAELGSADVYGPDGRVTSAREEPCCSVEDAEHMAINDPAYVLTDIASKRRIVERERWRPHGGLDCGGHPGPYMPHDDYGPGYCGRMDEENETLLDLAAPFSAEPGYKPEWAV